MALKKEDVLATLDDPLVGGMDFWVGNIHVHGKGFAIIRERILDDTITVVEGTNSTNAYYNPTSDTLTTQDANSPADLTARALLLHECTHALVDLAAIKVTTLTNEVTAYIAQTTYILLSDPRVVLWSSDPLWLKFYQDVRTLVQSFRLDTPYGRGVSLVTTDYASFRTQLNQLNIYQKVKDDQLTHSDGIKLNYIIPASPEPTTGRSRSISQDVSFIEIPGDTLFDVNKDVLKAWADPALHNVAIIIRAHLSRAPQGSFVQVNGHTDSTGSTAYNQGLSERRARTVGKWLIDHKHLTAQEVRSQGWGGEQPKAPNTTQDGRTKNRRVEFFISKR